MRLAGLLTHSQLASLLAEACRCNREVRHRGPCNHRATVPGLLAYSQRQLFESGVNVEELCRFDQTRATNRGLGWGRVYAV
jgi:hypothetical protein